MSHNNSPILISLSGSILLVMLVSTLGIVPSSTMLRADISAPISTLEKPEQEKVTYRDVVSEMFTARSPEEIRAEIAVKVSENKPDEAKKLYDELYMVEKYQK